MAFADGNIIIGTSVDVGGIDTGLHKIQKSFRRLGRLAVTTIGVGAFAKLGKAAIDAASDLQEVQNVVDVAFKDMSYKIEEFSKVCIEHFGMSEFAAKQSAGSFMAMGTAIGITKEVASDMAVELVGLSGDFASFFNITQKYAEVALSAIFTGETETIKRYGIILTEANLQEYAATIGIEKKVKAMSAAEKTLLRYNYVMERTTMLHGDFERTQENWANSVRVLQEQWHSLMVEMGAIFIQKVQPVVNLLNTILAKLIAIFKYLKELLGITSEIGEASFADEMGEMADAVDETGKAIKNQLAPFDKLNNITSSASGNVDDNVSDLEKLYEKAKLSGYVIDAMKNFEIQVTELSETMKKKLANIVNLFRRAKNRVEQIWNNIKLNHWFSAGMNFGDMITSLEKFVTDSISGIDWQKQGEKIGDFFKGIIWSDALGGFVDVLTSALDAVITMAVAAVDRISLQDVIKMAKNYSKAARKFLQWLSSVLKKVDWKAFGKKVGTFIAEIDWAGVFKDTVSVLFSALSGAIEAFNGLWDGLPLAGKVLLGLAAAWKVANWTGVIGNLNSALAEQLKAWKESGAFTRVFQGAVGVISFSTGIGIIGDTIDDIQLGEISAGSWEASLNNLIGSLLTTFGVSTVIGAFGLSLGPAGFLITTGVTFLASTIIDAIMEPTDEEKLELAREKFREKLRTLTWFKEFEETIDVLVNLRANVSVQFEDIEGDINYYNTIAEKWLELSENQDNLTKNEQTLMKLYADELVTFFPDLKDKINEISGAYEGTAESIQLIIDKTKELMQLEVYKAIYGQYKDEIAVAEKERLHFENTLDELKKRFEEEKSWRLANTIALHYLDANKVGAYTAWFFEQQYKGSPGGAISGLQKVVQQKLNKALEEGSYVIDLHGIEVDFSKAKIDFSEDLEGETFLDLETTINDSEQQLQRYIGNIQQMYAEMDTFIIEQAKLEASIRNKDIILALTSLSEAFDGTFEGVSDKWEKDVSAAAQSVLKELENGEELSKDKVFILFSTINEGLANLPDGELKQDLKQTLDNLYAQLNEGKIQYSEACLQMAKAMNSSFKIGLDEDPTLGDSTTKAFASMEEIINQRKIAVKKSMKQTGKYFTDGYIDGVEEGLPEVEKTSKKVPTTTISTIEDEGKISSPSKVTKELGYFMVAGYVNGIIQNIDLIRSAVTELMDATVSTMSDIAVSPSMTIIPDIDMSRTKIPDIVKGTVIPASISTTIDTATSNTMMGMTRSEFTDLLSDALGKLTIDLNARIEPDEGAFFRSMQTQATIYKNKTTKVAFQ